jgi:hypothetical protein
MIPSDMGNTCPLQSFSSNETSFMIHMLMGWILTMLNIYIKYLFCYSCMLSIRGKHTILITLHMAKT